jgi:hypothetical protein
MPGRLHSIQISDKLGPIFLLRSGPSLDLWFWMRSKIIRLPDQRTRSSDRSSTSKLIEFPDQSSQKVVSNEELSSHLSLAFHSCRITECLLGKYRIDVVGIATRALLRQGVHPQRLNDPGLLGHHEPQASRVH